MLFKWQTANLACLAVEYTAATGGEEGLGFESLFLDHQYLIGLIVGQFLGSTLKAGRHVLLTYRPRAEGIKHMQPLIALARAIKHLRETNKHLRESNKHLRESNKQGPCAAGLSTSHDWSTAENSAGTVNRGLAPSMNASIGPVQAASQPSGPAHKSV